MTSTVQQARVSFHFPTEQIIKKNISRDPSEMSGQSLLKFGNDWFGEMDTVDIIFE